MDLNGKMDQLRSLTIELLKYADKRGGRFSNLDYTCLDDIFKEPFFQDSTLSRVDVEGAFMARRIQQMMRLPMSVAEEGLLNSVISDVDRWKEKTSYLYHHAGPPSGEEPAKSFRFKEINEHVRAYFESCGLKEITARKGGGYLTWIGILESKVGDFKVVFDIRTKYMGKMRFNIFFPGDENYAGYYISNMELFGELIYSILKINYNPKFIYMDNEDHRLPRLANYLSLIGLIVRKIGSWSYIENS